MTSDNDRWMMFLVFVVFFIALSVQFASSDDPAYTVEGGTVYINDSQAYISATPHTLGKSEYVYINLMSKLHSGNVSMGISVLSFDKAQIYKPKTWNVTKSFRCAPPFFGTGNATHFYCWKNVSVYNETLGYNVTERWRVYDHYYEWRNNSIYTAYWNETRSQTWVKFKREYKTVEHNNQTWQYIENVSIQQDLLYQSRFWLDVPYDESGKYDVCFWPSNKGIRQARDDGQLYCLDPWYGGSSYKHNYDIKARCVPCGSTLTSVLFPISFNTTIDYININATPQLVWLYRDLNSSWQTVAKFPHNNETNYTFVDSGGSAEIYHDVDEGNSTDAGTPPGNLIGLWHSDSLVQLEDNSSYGNPCVIAGNPTLAVGHLGNWVDYDGTGDYANCGQAIEFNLSAYSEFTLYSWLYMDAISASVASMIVSKYDGSTIAYLIDITKNDGANPRRLFASIANDTVRVDVASAKEFMNINTLYFVAFTVNSTHAVLYRDGAFVAKEDTPEGAFLDLSTPFQIGADSLGGNPFNGKIGEVQFWNESHSAAVVNFTYISQLDNSHNVT